MSYLIAIISYDQTQNLILKMLILLLYFFFVLHGLLLLLLLLLEVIYSIDFEPFDNNFTSLVTSSYYL